MRILLDIGHPAHVHYFRNAVKELQGKGHQFLITTRDKEITLDLLEHYKLKYHSTGKNLPGKLNKLYSMIRNDARIYAAARRFRPDIFLSFYTPFAAHVGKLMNKPVLAFMDSEFDKVRIKLTKPFTDYTFTPRCYWDNMGEKHFRFNGYMETFYLHPNWFRPDATVLDRMGVKPGEKYFILRFVAFNAGHDVGEKGIDDASKERLIGELLKLGKVFISSEKPLPPQYKSLAFKVPPAEFHSAIYYASLYVGEGITTASECAHLGTPAVLINTIRASYILEQEQLGLVHQFLNFETAYEKIIELAADDNAKANYIAKSAIMTEKLMDCTGFLINLLEQFPDSLEKLPKDRLIDAAL